MAPTGARIEIDEIAMYKVHDGEVVQMSNVHDVEALKKQLAGRPGQPDIGALEEQPNVGEVKPPDHLATAGSSGSLSGPA